MQGAVVVMAGAVTEVEVAIPEDFLDMAFPVDSLGAEDLAAEALGAIAEGDIGVVTAALGAIADIEVVTAALGATVPIEEAIAQDTMEVMLQDIITEDTIIPEDITEAIQDIITEDMPHTEQPSGFSLAGWLLEVYIVHSGGLITPCQYLRTIMTLIINIPILHLPM
jgi:hypothetical protein